MTTKEKIIRRLNKGFGFDIPIDANWKTHERAFRNCGGLSWYISDIRCLHGNYGADDCMITTERNTLKVMFLVRTKIDGE